MRRFTSLAVKLGLGLGLAAAFIPGHALAQAYPSKPV